MSVDGVRHFLDLTDFSGEQLRCGVEAIGAIKAICRHGDLAGDAA